MAAFLCAEECDGCGVLWTPNGDTRPVQPDNQRWAWCPDCVNGADDG